MSTISVLIPIYFKESQENIFKCLKSIMQQTVLPDEIVFALDDPSSDEIEHAIELYEQKVNIRFVKCYCPRGSGLGAVLKTGVESCSCEYVARMDVDDIALPSRLEIEKHFLDDNKHVDIVGSNIAEFEDNIDNVVAYRIVPETDEECKKMLRKRDPFNHMTVMFRRTSILNAGNYPSMMVSNEDYFLWVDCYVAGLTFANIQDVLVYAHAGAAMYERRGGKKAYTYVKKVIKHKREVRLIGAFEALRQRIINYIVLVIMTKKMRALFYTKFLRKSANA